MIRCLHVEWKKCFEKITIVNRLASRKNWTEIVVFFDQSKTNRNHEKLKVDFHCRVILLMLMSQWEFNWLFVCEAVRSFFFYSIFLFYFVRFGRGFYEYWDRWITKYTTKSELKKYNIFDKPPDNDKILIRKKLYW